MNTLRLICTAGLFACGMTAAIVVGAAAAPQPAELTSVKNFAHPFPWLYTGGQPDARALAGLARSGVRDVYDLRAAGEPRGLDERATAESLGLHYVPIPMSGVADFTDSRFTAFRRHLIAHGANDPMFIHCAAGNRVGAALLPWLVLDQGLTEDLALEMARSVGLRDEALKQRALEYVRARQTPVPLR
jgi:protein tyrosine phosphatase (PTP) superfamily phosphohydrolase (DUF442 family)